jgi:hypothetical protein
MEFPNGPMTIDMLLIASLLLVFLFVMLIIGVNVWMESNRTPEKRRAAPRVPASRPTGSGHDRVHGRALRQNA